MARARKPEKIDTVYFHDTGESIEIMQNRNDWTFFAEYQGEIVSHAEKAKMPQLVRELYARLHVELEWTRMIEIHTGPTDERGRVELSYRCRDFAIRPSDHRIMERRVSFGADYANPSKSDMGKVHTSQPSIWQGWYYNMIVPGISENNQISRFTQQQQSAMLQLPLYGRGAAYLPYSDELWQALKRISGMIVRLHDELHKIVTTPEGNELLLNFSAANLLPAGGVIAPVESEDGE